MMPWWPSRVCVCFYVVVPWMFLLLLHRTVYSYYSCSTVQYSRAGVSVLFSAWLCVYVCMRCVCVFVLMRCLFSTVHWFLSHLAMYSTSTVFYCILLYCTTTTASEVGWAVAGSVAGDLSDSRMHIHSDCTPESPNLARAFFYLKSAPKF
jgi:hypothetical protein